MAEEESFLKSMEGGGAFDAAQRLEAASRLVRNPAFTTDLARRIAESRETTERAVFALRRSFLPDASGKAGLEDEEADAHLNPFEITVEEMLDRFWKANVEEAWKFGEDVYERLAATAPPWPVGELAFRSLRIRFGHGDKGVQQTFEAHCARLKHTNGCYRRADDVRSDKSHLRLLLGNDSHKPKVEWICFDLRRNWQGAGYSFPAELDPRLSADEALVFAWMFPAYVLRMGRALLPILASGYELKNPYQKAEDTWWRDAPEISHGLHLGTDRRKTDNSNSSSEVYTLAVIPVLSRRYAPR